MDYKFCLTILRLWLWFQFQLQIHLFMILTRLASNFYLVSIRLEVVTAHVFHIQIIHLNLQYEE